MEFALCCKFAEREQSNCKEVLFEEYHPSEIAYFFVYSESVFDIRVLSLYYIFYYVL